MTTPARIEVLHANALSLGAWKWPHIDPVKEWADRMSGQLVYVPAFLDRLEQLRGKFGKPIPINSGYRTPEHNLVVSDTGDNGPHTTGRACDVHVYGADALRLVGLALAAGFTGIGVQQKGSVNARYLHLDDLTEADGYPRPMIWSY
jgi:zinc D-Ala-D-Ala carboxypeptidase